jgi:Tfp pilus assembly protein PilF
MDKAREYFRKMIEIDPKASVATLMRAIYVWKDKHS